MNEIKKNRSRKKVSVLQSTQLYTSASQPVLGIIITFQFLLPALFSSCIKEDRSIINQSSINLSSANPYGSTVIPEMSADIFTFNDDELQLLDSYQHITDISSGKLNIRSQNGSKFIFICANSRKERYDWSEIRTLESLDKVTADLREEKRGGLLMTGTGRISAGKDSPCDIELRPIVSEILLNSIRCDFSDTSYEGESLRDVRIYLTNVNCRCSITAQENIMPIDIINAGGLDMDDVASFAESDIIYQKLEEPIGEKKTYPKTSLLCYPNSSEKETPGSPFTRLVIEGKIDDETYWWPIEINQGRQTVNKGIERNVSYIYDITIKRKGTEGPDIPVNAEDVDIRMTTTEWKEMEDRPVRFTFSVPGYHTRAATSYEDCISDLNLIIFRNGRLESIIWQEYGAYPDAAALTARLVTGETYSFYAIANIGHKISYEEAVEPEKLVIDITQTDGNGILMSAVMEDVSVEDAEDIHIRLTRMMAKISLKIDRSHLNEDVDIEVTDVRLCNCPRYAAAIGPNRASSRHDCLSEGPTLSGNGCAALNHIGHKGLSNEISMYMLENMQGRFPYDIDEDEEKVFDEEDIMSEICSFMEIEMKYRSGKHFTDNGNLIYRHHLGDGTDNLDIERNCHYHITVTPENDGLNGSGWRTDKTAIGTFVQDISLAVDRIDMTYRGQTIQLEANAFPDEATYKELIWESSDTMVAEISEKGLVTAMSEGTCIIKCSSSDGSETECECLVTVKYAPPYFRLYPADYIEGHVGDKLHIWCEVFPPNAPFDPGYEELEFDKSRGIYEYETDPDGHGVTLTLLKPGIGIIYMSAGEPVNESGMVIVRVLS